MPKLSSRLQLKDFRLIQAIRETGQLALAAQRLSMTQPAASRKLAEIERMIGAPLFERHPKGMTPTPLGEILARNAASLLNGVDQTLEEMAAVRAGRAGTARVGAVTGAALAFLLPAIQALKRTSVGAEIHFDIAPSDALIAGLLRGEYDFVLSRIPSGVDSRRFALRRGRVEEILLLARAEHPLASRAGLSLADARDCEWVIQAAHTPLRQTMESAFVAQGMALPREIVNTTSFLVMIAYLASSDAVAPVAREVYELLSSDIVSARLVALDLADPVVVNPYHLVSLQDQLMSPLAMRLRDLVSAAMDQSAKTERSAAP